MSKTIDDLIANMPQQIFDWLEISDDVQREWYKGAGAKFGGHKDFIAKNKAALKDLILVELPKKKSGLPNLEGLSMGQIRGYNQALDDVRQALDKLFNER